MPCHARSCCCQFRHHQTILSEEVNTDLIYRVEKELRAYHIYDDSDISQFCDVYFANGCQDSSAQGLLVSKMMYTPLKNGKERTITLTVTALNVLREAKRKQNEMHLRAGSSWHNEYNMIFTRSNGMFVRFKTLYVHFKAIVKRMGRPEVRFHDVRHTYATLSLQSHVDPKTLSEALGHATVAFTLDVYGHSNADMRQQAADQLERLICQY